MILQGKVRTTDKTSQTLSPKRRAAYGGDICQVFRKVRALGENLSLSLDLKLLRRQQVEETEARVGLVLQDVSGPAEEL